MNRPSVAVGLVVALMLFSARFSGGNEKALPPDAGISDEELGNLGTKMVPTLIERLGDPGNEKYFEGLVHRLNIAALESGPDQRIQHAFESFVETNAKRKEVPFSTEMAMYHALRAMGYVGGDAGVDYLIDWVQAGHVKKVKTHAKKGTVSMTASELRDAAVLGLGFSGRPKARKFLEEQSETKPNVPYMGGFQGAVKDALKYSKEVEKSGAKEFLLPKLKGPDKKQPKKR